MKLLVHVLDMAASRDSGPKDGRSSGDECNSFHVDSMLLFTETLGKL